MTSPNIPVQQIETMISEAWETGPAICPPGVTSKQFAKCAQHLAKANGRHIRYHHNNGITEYHLQ